ncbi:hypothetical protein ATCC90586_008597 [Pythium insidiosum]|nr:hypothetical protein ATCC90586_008597 [Pythium insidiosum]
MTGGLDSPVPSRHASVVARPHGKLSVVAPPPGDVLAPSPSPSPRTPRRESRDTLRAPRRPPGRGGAGQSSAAVSNQSASDAPANAAAAQAGAAEDGKAANADGAGTAAGSGFLEADGGASSRPLRRSRRWVVVRKEVRTNPEITKVSDRVLHIIQMLRKPPEDRLESDIKVLYAWLMSQEKLSSLFTTMSEVSAKKLCKEMEFLHLQAGDIVVNQGDKGNTCFILISGLVSVFVRSPDDQKKYHRMVRASVDGVNVRRMAEQGVITLGNKVATLTPGATFGELCLIEPDSKRSATVIVDPSALNANFIVLTAASYLRMTRSQTIEGTITDHIAFLQHMLVFRKWTKMQLMHLVNSMKLLSVPAGQYIAHKGSDAESFFVILRGDAQESVKLTLNEPSDSSSTENRSTVQHCITVELTFLGKFDVAGEYLAAEKKVVTCPVDIRAVTDVDCLRKLFNLHFGGKDLKKHAARALHRLRVIAEQREMWRETRIAQALQYPHFRVPITRKLMRLSGNQCIICGRRTHVAGDELCMELATYHMEAERKKKQRSEEASRAMSRHRISVSPLHQQQHAQLAAAAAAAEAQRAKLRLPSLQEDLDDEEEEDEDEDGEEDRDEDGAARAVGRRRRRPGRLGLRLVQRQWKVAERAGLHAPSAPASPLDRRATTAHDGLSLDRRVTSVTRSVHVSRRRLLERQRTRAERQQHESLDDQIQRIRACWPYRWRELDPPSDEEDPEGARVLPSFERLYRNRPRSPRSPRPATTPRPSPSGSRSRAASVRTAPSPFRPARGVHTVR